MIHNVALLYTRVSRLDEEERARKVSPEMQRDKALALRELNGLEIEHFEDLDISGKSAINRPAYQRLLQRLERGDVAYVVAYDQSRITRNVGDLQRFREALVLHGALFLESSTGRLLDPEDEDQELGSNVIGSVDQHYRRKLARRVRDALATKVARGELVGPVPTGYIRRREILSNGKIARTWVEVDEAAAPTIRTIFREYATGAHSLRSLARALNARGILPPRRADIHAGRGRRPDGSPEHAELFTADVLKDLLTNPRYMGLIPTRSGQMVRGVHEPLVDELTWHECERIRLRHANARLKLVVRSGSRYLLSGVLRCASCGGTMSGQTFRADTDAQLALPSSRSTHRTTRYRYTCYRRRVGAPGCAEPSLDQAPLEDELREVLALIALPEGFASAVDEAAASSRVDPVTTPQAASPALRARLGRLRELYELGDLTRAEYLARREQLRAKLEAPSSPSRTDDFSGRREQLTTLVDHWGEMTLEERHQLIVLIFPAVYAGVGGIRRLRPHEDWMPYIAAAVARISDREPAIGTRDLTERKTGLRLPDTSRTNARPRSRKCEAAPTRRVRRPRRFRRARRASSVEEIRSPRSTTNANARHRRRPATSGRASLRGIDAEGSARASEPRASPRDRPAASAWTCA